MTTTTTISMDRLKTLACLNLLQQSPVRRPRSVAGERNSVTQGQPLALSKLLVRRGQGIDVEALIAISVGFPMDLLIEEEIEANVVSTIGDIEQATQDVAMRHPWPPMGWLADNWQPLLCYFFLKKR
jgi:hypothetical protein